MFAIIAGRWSGRSDSTTVLAIDRWYHIAVTIDSQYNTELYVNGVSEDTGNCGSIYASTGSLNLGASWSQAYRLEGKMDNVMILNSDLNDDEVAALYSHGRLRYDEAGNLVYDRQGYAYKYDYENRLTKIQQDGSDIVEYTYDALGRRIEKKDHVTSANTRRYFYSKDWQVLNEYDGSATPIFKGTYLYGNYVDEVLVSMDWHSAPLAVLRPRPSLQRRGPGEYIVRRNRTL